MIYCKPELAKIALAGGANIGTTAEIYGDKFSDFLAAEWGKSFWASQLFEGEVDANYQNADGIRALDVATHEDIRQVWLKAGARFGGNAELF